MEAKIDALEFNKTWVITDLSHGKTPIDYKYVYKTKYNPNVRTILALVAVKGWHLHQFDVNNDFLNGELQEEIYMTRSSGYQKGNLGQFGSTQSNADYSLFTCLNGSNFTALLVYVNDIVVASNSLDSISSLKTFLNHHFKIKDLGQLRYFLSIEVAKSPTGIHICQRKYTLDILADAGHLASKPYKIPMDQNHRVSKTTGSPLSDPTPYRQLIGRLLYLTLTRPNINYLTQVLNQFMDAPTNVHLAVAHKILRYLKTAPGQGIFLFSTSFIHLKGYCDSDWASCPDTRKSVTDYYAFMGNSLISWCSKKQTMVSRSFAKAEYRAMTSLCTEFT
ncbi:uncharacterized mitochondrial protein AtMg00810-like [Juglans microcarpa x Juglans regia]|uniref:uncharacterized mitochondrial protein AtMg00810-like n=1 Tax=Juglans microcarpa x Juglans regia TaxID=2249226 RepID=UPI001B7E086B|nr:uncharacterized mitochondrial protein AtMg00810-like [Juglans microcarpa x Juglans regia]